MPAGLPNRRIGISNSIPPLPNPSSDGISLHHIPIDLDTETRFGRQWDRAVGTQHEFFVPHGVGARCLNAGLCHPWIGVAFTNPADAAFGMDDDDKTVLRGRGEGHVKIRCEQDVTLDRRDLEGGRC